MARFPFNRQSQQVRLPKFAGLVTKDDYATNNPLLFSIAQNALLDQDILVRNTGARNFSNTIANYYGTGLHHGYHINDDNSDRIYTGMFDHLYQMKKVNNIAYEVDSYPVNLPGGGNWGQHEFISFVDMFDWTFAFNGKGQGIQIGSDASTGVWFGLETPGAPTAASGTGTGITGDITWYYRYVAEDVHGNFLYMGPRSVGVTIGLTNQDADITYAIPTDSQITAIYIERSNDGQLTPYYRDRIDVAGATGIYNDSLDVVDPTVQYPQYLPRPMGTKFCCKDTNRLVTFGTLEEDTLLTWCEDGFPQHRRVEFQDYMTDGSGPSTGVVSLGDNFVITFRQKGLSYWQLDNNQMYQYVGGESGYGNISRAAIKSKVAVNQRNGKQYTVCTFVDEVQGLCYLYLSGSRPTIRSLREVGDNDIRDIIDNQMNKFAKDQITVGDSPQQLFVSYPSIGSNVCDMHLTFDKTTERWMGPHKGVAFNHCFTRLATGDITKGKGEVLACSHEKPMRLIELNYGITYPGGAPEFKVRTVPIAASSPNLKQICQIQIRAKITKAVRVDVLPTGGNGFYSYYLVHGSPEAFYNGPFTYDGGFTWDTTSIPLFDDGKTYDHVNFNDVEWADYYIYVDDACNCSTFALGFYSNEVYNFKIADVFVRFIEKGLGQ